MRAAVLAALLGASACAVDAPALDAQHPANAAAVVGRLAGAPAELRPGGVVYSDVPASPASPAMPMPMHHHHGT